MAITTREQIAAAGIQDILRREDYQPELLKDMAKALAKARNTLPPPDAVIIRNKSYSLKTIEERLAQFIHYLPPDNRPEITDTSFYDENFLNQLISTIDEVSGLTPSAEAKVSMDAVVPKNLQELLEAQAKVTAEKKQALGRPSQLEIQIEQAQKIGIRAQLLRVAVSKNLFTTLNESSYIRDLQTIYGKETVNQLLAKRIDLAVNQSITALAINQLGLSDPSHAASYFAAQLEKNLKSDRNLAAALAKTHQADRKNVLTDAKNLAEDTAKEAAPAAKAFRDEQNSSPIYRANAENIARGEIEASLSKSGQILTKKQAGRLAEALAKYHDPEKQLQILKRILPAVTPEAGQQLIENLNPAISTLTKSSDHPTIAETINESSLVNLARTNPALFPLRLTAAIRANRLSTGETTALIVRLSQQLGVSPDYVAMRLTGISAQSLEKHLVFLTKGQPALGFLPTQPPLRPDNLIFQRLNNALPGIGRLDQLREEFQFSPIATGLNLRSNWHSVAHFLNVGKAVRFNLGRLPPVGRMVSSVQTVFSGLRVQSGAVNSVFNFFSSVSGGFGKLGSAAAYPFRAAGSLMSTGWNNVKTWAGTQVKAGLAKAGAWLAKKGVTAAASKLGLMAVGKGAAALMAQAVPIAGQVAGVLTVLSILGDIGKFIWDHKKEIGLGLGGMFFLGQMLLAKVLGFLGSAAWTLGGALAGGIGGFLVGGPVGAAIGAGLGGMLGFAIGSGTLGTALSGLGSALGSAAAGFGSFLGALSAPSLVAGLGTTIATMGIGGLLVGTAITVFFTQPTINSALFVPLDETAYAPGGIEPPEDPPGLENKSSCPIKDFYILHNSYNPTTQTGHGSNDYWQRVRGNESINPISGKSSWCTYPMPQLTDCAAPLYPGTETNRCYSMDESQMKYTKNLCDTYGYATDVFPNTATSWSVWLPQINGQDTQWSYLFTFENSGSGWSHIYSAANYQIVFTHLEQDVLTGPNLSSGTKVGKLFNQGSNTHLHMEVAVNQVYVKPENYFCGI